MGEVLASIAGIITSAVLARIFSQDTYSTYRQALLVYSILIPFSILGFDRGLFYFLPEDLTSSRRLLVENLLWFAFSGTIVALMLFVGAGKLIGDGFSNNQLSSMLISLAPFLILTLPASSVSACLLATNNAWKVAVYNVGSKLLGTVLIISFSLSAPNLRSVVIGMVLTAVISTSFALVLMFTACNKGPWMPTTLGFRRQFSFCAPLGLATLVAALSQRLDQVIVASLCDTKEFAVYVNGAMELPLIGVITGSITSVLLVDYTRLYKVGDIPGVLGLMHVAMRKCAILLFPIMGCALCASRELMVVLYGEQYADSATPFTIYLFTIPIRILTFTAILQSAGKSRAVFLSSLIAIVGNVVFLQLAVYIAGPLWAPLGSIGSLYMFVVPYLIWQIVRTLQCSLKEVFPWIQLAKIFLGSFVAVPIVFIVKASSEIPSWSLRLIESCSIYLVLTAVVYYFFGFFNMFPNMTNLLAKR